MATKSSRPAPIPIDSSSLQTYRGVRGNHFVPVPDHPGVLVADVHVALNSSDHSRGWGLGWTALRDIGGRFAARCATPNVPHRGALDTCTVVTGGVGGEETIVYSLNTRAVDRMVEVRPVWGGGDFPAITAILYAGEHAFWYVDDRNRSVIAVDVSARGPPVVRRHPNPGRSPGAGFTLVPVDRVAAVAPEEEAERMRNCRVWVRPTFLDGAWSVDVVVHDGADVCPPMASIDGEFALAPPPIPNPAPVCPKQDLCAVERVAFLHHALGRPITFVLGPKGRPINVPPDMRTFLNAL